MVRSGHSRIVEPYGHAHRTGHDLECAQRVSTLRREHGIHAYHSAEKNGEWLTMSEAAELLGVSHHVIRRLSRERILRAEQMVPGAPHQIRASDLRSEQVAPLLPVNIARVG